MPHNNSPDKTALPYPALLMVILLLTAGLASTFFMPWERTVLETVQPFGDTPAGELFVQGAKYLGNGFYQALPVAIILFAAWRRRNTKLFRRMLAVLYALAISGIVANILKFAIGKARPGEKLGNWHMVPFSSANDFHSFPSGHTTTSFALAFVLSYFYPRLAPALFGAAVLIAAGRVVGESHFPGDVMGGAILGIALGWALTQYYRKNMRESE